MKEEHPKVMRRSAAPSALGKEPAFKRGRFVTPFKRPDAGGHNELQRISQSDSINKPLQLPSHEVKSLLHGNKDLFFVENSQNEENVASKLPANVADENNNHGNKPPVSGAISFKVSDKPEKPLVHKQKSISKSSNTKTDFRSPMATNLINRTEQRTGYYNKTGKENVHSQNMLIL